MFALRKPVEFALRAVVALGCCLGIWYSLMFAWADHEFSKDTADSLRAAISLAPDGWQYYMRLAQLDPVNAKQLLDSSLRLNPYDAQADIELGLQNEAEGDYPAAEKHLLQAFNIDHTYMPRWTLANFYYRRDNLPEFWAWARSAAAIPSDDIGGLLDLCWRASPDPATVSAAIFNRKPEFLRQYVNFLATKDQSQAAGEAALNLFRVGDKDSDLPVMLSVVDHLVAAYHPTEAASLWHLLIQKQWMYADWSFPNNPRFARTPVRTSFDWSLPDYRGLHSLPGPSGLDTEFSGNEPENCVIAKQYVVLNPGDYMFTSDYHTSDIRPGTGIHWQIVDPQSQAVLAQSDDLSSESQTQSQVAFTIAPGSSLVLLQLGYTRTLGTVRVTGTLNVKDVQISAAQ